jgi:hypothetical protein
MGGDHAAERHHAMRSSRVAFAEFADKFIEGHNVPNMVRATVLSTPPNRTTAYGSKVQI